MNTKSKTFHALWIGVIVLGGLFVLHTFPPEQHDFYPRCWLHEHTGLLCPGCGSTRAISHLLHGRWRDAWQCNAPLMLALPILLIWWIRETRRWFQGQPAFAIRWSTPVIYGTVTFLILYAVIRNIPGQLTAWLRPPG